MSSTIIISRFDENLSWLERYKSFNIIVYNKGEELKKNNFKKIYNLKNVGRESHTWLHHIVRNYDQLDDINIFLQGKIDDLNCMAFQDVNLYEKNMSNLGFCCSRLGLLGPFHWKDNIGIEKNPKYLSQWKNEGIRKSNLGFRRFAKKLFPNIPLFVATSYGGCFAVKRELIQQHNKDFYKYILTFLEDHKNPIEGHYMERLWCFMFTQNNLILKSFRDVLKTKFERYLLKKL